MKTFHQFIWLLLLGMALRGNFSAVARADDEPAPVVQEQANSEEGQLPLGESQLPPNDSQLPVNGTEQVEPVPRWQLVEQWQLNATQQGIDAAELKRIEKLVVEYPQDYPDPGAEEIGQAAVDQREQEREAARQQRVDAIRSSPGITPYLFALLDKHYRLIESDGWPSVLGAIALRDDLGEKELKLITDELDRILEKPFKVVDWKDGMKVSFLSHGVLVLKKFPSPKNEDLALRILNFKGDPNNIPMEVNAAETLAAIGTEKSAGPLLKVFDEVKTYVAGDSGALKRMKERMDRSISHLQRRLKDESKGPVRVERTQLDHSGTEVAAGSGAGTRMVDFLSPVFWGLVVCFAGAAVLAAFSRMRKNRR